MAERGQQASHPIPPLPPPSRAKIRTPFRLLKEQDDVRYEQYDDERDMLILEEDLDTVMKSLPHHTAARLRYEERGGRDGRHWGLGSGKHTAKYSTHLTAPDSRPVAVLPNPHTLFTLT